MEYSNFSNLTATALKITYKTCWVFGEIGSLNFNE